MGRPRKNLATTAAVTSPSDSPPAPDPTLLPPPVLLPVGERVPLGAPDGAARLASDAKAQSAALANPDGKNGTIPQASAPRGDVDLSELALVDSVEVVLVDPRRPSAKIDTGLRVYIRSLYSNEVRAAIEKARARRRAMMGEGITEIAPDEQEDAILEQIISATVGWSSGPNYPTALLMRKATADTPAEAWEWSPANVRKLYTDRRYTWIARQVEQAYLDLDRFFSPPSTN